MAAVLMPLPARTEQPTSEPTRFFPREGRTPPARLQLVPEPTEERTTIARDSGGRVTWKDILRLRGEIPSASKPARKAERAAFVPVYLRKGYRWDLLGEALHEHMRHEASKPAAIRPCPPTLAKLLATPEWKGAMVSEPTEAELLSLKGSVARALLDAKAAESKAKGKANKARAAAHVAAHESRLARLHEARRVVHPSGAALLWHPL